MASSVNYNIRRQLLRSLRRAELEALTDFTPNAFIDIGTEELCGYILRKWNKETDIKIYHQYMVWLRLAADRSGEKEGDSSK